jgi:hypothetical protein
MRFANKSGLIAIRPEQSREAVSITFFKIEMGSTKKLMITGILAGYERDSRRRANRIIAIGPIESDAVFLQKIEVWGFNGPAGGAKTVSVKLIRHYP